MTDIRVRAFSTTMIIVILMAVMGCGGGQKLNNNANSQNTDSVDLTQPDNTLPGNQQQGQEQQALANAIDQLMSQWLARSNVVNASVFIDAPSLGFSYSNAVGLANPQTAEAMSTDHAFRIASISKTFIAVVVLQLMEEGRLQLHSTLGNLLPDSLFPSGYSVDDLHRIGNISHGADITIEQLLRHTSGVRDYLMESPAGVRSGADSGLVNRLIFDYLSGGALGLNQTQWNKSSLIDYYVSADYGSGAVFVPGQGYHYSDSGYLLLGAVIEAVTGQTLTANLRQRILNPLGMQATYHENFEPARGILAHHFYDLSGAGIAQNLDVVASGENTSAAWAGGSLVSTLADLMVYNKALMTGQLFNNDNTLALMQQSSTASPFYGLGLQSTSYDGCDVWGHSGFWGTLLAYCEQRDVWLVMALNQVEISVYDTAASLYDALNASGL